MKVGCVCRRMSLARLLSSTVVMVNVFHVCGLAMETMTAVITVMKMLNIAVSYLMTVTICLIKDRVLRIKCSKK